MSNSVAYGARRDFLRFVAASPLMLPALARAERGALSPQPIGAITAAEQAISIFELRDIARKNVRPAPWAWMSTGSDEEKTLAENERIFDDLQLKIRRLIDVRTVDTSVSMFGQKLASPICLSPIGLQSVFHPDAELATARAADARGHLMISGNLSTISYPEQAAISKAKPWLQLYARWERPVVKDLLQRVEAAGCPAVALTVDVPVGGNRETTLRWDPILVAEGPVGGGPLRFGNMPATVEPLAAPDAGITWEYVDWLKANTSMKVLLKGVVAAEDARDAKTAGVDGLVLSNHGGRQEESGRSTLECLPEVLEAFDGAGPIVIDSGFRRGTDVYKALALGATAVAVGRPQIWGLGAFGEAGVAQVLALLQAELVKVMQLAGVTRIADITRASVFATAGGAFAARAAGRKT